MTSTSKTLQAQNGEPPGFGLQEELRKPFQPVRPHSNLLLLQSHCKGCGA